MFGGAGRYHPRISIASTCCRVFRLYRPRGLWNGDPRLKRVLLLLLLLLLPMLVLVLVLLLPVSVLLLVLLLLLLWPQHLRRPPARTTSVLNGGLTGPSETARDAGTEFACHSMIVPRVGAMTDAGVT